MSAIETPCILVCTIDMASGYCVGCGRTRAEIASWLAMTPQARREVMAQLPGRLASKPDHRGGRPSRRRHEG